MRPAGRSETDSLYFTYPEFSAPSPALRDKRAAAPVAIVGTGPIGMTAALALAREGILHYAAHSVRLIVRYKPAIAAGARSNAMVSNMNLYSTILDYTGLPSEQGTMSFFVTGTYRLK